MTRPPGLGTPRRGGPGSGNCLNGHSQVRLDRYPQGRHADPAGPRLELCGGNSAQRVNAAWTVCGERRSSRCCATRRFAEAWGYNAITYVRVDNQRLLREPAVRGRPALSPPPTDLLPPAAIADMGEGARFELHDVEAGRKKLPLRVALVDRREDSVCDVLREQ
jgi:hypothetical protein